MFIVVLAITTMIVFEQIAREFNGHSKGYLYRVYQFSTLLNGCLVGAYFSNRTLAVYSTILPVYRWWLLILDGLLIYFWNRGKLRPEFKRTSIVMQTTIIVEVLTSLVLKNVLTFCV